VAKLDAGRGLADAGQVRSILRELNVPPVKKNQAEGLLRYEAMPPFKAKVLDDYPPDDTPTPLREAVERTQAVLWAISPNAPPQEVAGAVAKIRESGELKADLGGLRESFRAPGGGNAENQFKNTILNDERRVASMLRILEEELDSTKKAGEGRKKAPRRWQA